MKAMKWNVVTLFVSMFVFVLISALLLLSDISPPKELALVEGRVVNLTRIETKRKLTGFRFCVGDPLKTFTYLDPDPDVALAWSALQDSKVVRVQYAVHQYQNPTLWGLEADNKSVVTTSELEAARVRRFVLLLVGACVSGTVVIFSFRSWFRSRRLRHPAQSLAAADGFAAR
ncbi:MAG: hypothetical protein GXC94_14410 [Comamonadaceae bacterium]|jgi:hypothetical protein|nr:hypothetical protein [Comamonadaceae bacterium]